MKKSIDRSEAYKPLTIEQLRESASAIFTEEKAARTSSIYSKTSTIKIIEDLQVLGWQPIRAVQRKSKIVQGYQKHCIWFRNESLMILTGEGETVEAYPEICLINSHDGLTAFHLSLSLFRVACSNGLVFQSDQFSNFRIIHKGYNFVELEKIVLAVVERAPAMIEAVEGMKGFLLNPNQVKSFVREALEIRQKYSQGVKIAANLSDMVEATRPEDAGSSLWVTYNKVQERLIKGGWLNTDNGRITKPITYLDKILWVNKDLFALTERYYKEYLATAPVGVEGMPAYDQYQQIKQLVREGKSIPDILTTLDLSKKAYYKLLTDEQKEELNQIRLLLKS